MHRQEIAKLIRMLELSDLTWEQRISMNGIIDSVTELVMYNDTPDRDSYRQALEDAISDFISDCEEADEIKKKKYDE